MQAILCLMHQFRTVDGRDVEMFSLAGLPVFSKSPAPSKFENSDFVGMCLWIYDPSSRHFVVLCCTSHNYCFYMFSGQVSGACIIA